MWTILSAIPFPQLDPVFFRLGPIAVRWYGLAYLTGFAFAYWGLSRQIRSGRLRLTNANLSELVGWSVAGVIIGGRLGWWLFYHRSSGAFEPWYEPLAVWHGGMSFHGGLIGVILVTAIWAWRRQLPALHIADALALVTPVGLLFGRLANFINAELVGRPTEMPWGVIFPGELFARHPSQLYEALLEGPVLLLCLWWYSRWRQVESTKNAGRVAGAFLLLYGTFRFAVEFTRQPDEQLGYIAFGWLTMGQLLSAGLVLLGIGLVAWKSVRPRTHDQPVQSQASAAILSSRRNWRTRKT